jgi:hypothetical protein
MDRKAFLRWAVLLGTAAITAAFSFYPTEENSIVSPAHEAKRAEGHLGVVPMVATNVDENAGENQDPLDPFAPRGWQPPPPVEATIAPVAQPAVPAAPPAPAGPPPLPFKFMGAMNDDGALTIYLSKGDQAMAARVDDVLDGSYKVLALDNQHIDFEYMPTNEKQTLTFPASEN